MKVKGFVILTNDKYVELAATINKQLQLDISDVNLEVVDYQFTAEQNGHGMTLTDKPKAKRPRNGILNNSKYAELSTAFNEIYRSNISRKDIAFMDITLQNHRAVNLATQLIKNPVVDITDDPQSSRPPAAAGCKNHARTTCTAVTPITGPTIKTEPINTNPPQQLYELLSGRANPPTTEITALTPQLS
jgi:hypothetical protein